MIKNTRFITKGKKVLQITRHELKELDKSTKKETVIRKNENTLFHQTTDIYRKKPANIQQLSKKKPFRLQKRNFQIKQQINTSDNTVQTYNQQLEQDITQQKNILTCDTPVSCQQQENVSTAAENSKHERHQSAEIQNDNRNNTSQESEHLDSSNYYKNKNGLDHNNPLIAKTNETKLTDNQINVHKSEFQMTEMPDFFGFNEQEIETPAFSSSEQDTDKQSNNTPELNKTKPQNIQRKPINQPTIPTIVQLTDTGNFKNFDSITSTESKPEPKKSIQRAEKKLEKVENQLAKAQKKTPYQGQFQSTEKQGTKPTKYKTGKKKVASFAKKTVQKSFHAAVSNTAVSLHRKVSETEKDNIGIEAAHKTEQFVERSGSFAIQSAKNQQKKHPYQKVKQLEKKWKKANIYLQYQKQIQNNEIPKKNPLSKLFLKRKIKRQYQKAYKQARATGTTVQQAMRMNSIVGKAIQKVVAKHFPIFALLAVLLILFALLSSGLSSCSSALTGGVSAIVSTSYTAPDKDINLAEAYYCSLESALQSRLNAIEQECQGYDEYRKSIGNIGHSPYELMALLTVLYDDFQFDSIKTGIEKVFEMQYPLDITETTEYKSDGDGGSYAWHVLHVKLSPLSFTDISAKLFADAEQKERYNTYLLTKGGRQYFSSPFGFDWMPYIQSIHDDNSMSLFMANGSMVSAGKDGTVIQAGAKTVILQDKHGYSAIYQGLDTITVVKDQDIKTGEAIGTAGSNMRLTFSFKGENLNPYFFVASIGSGLSGGIAFPDDPGSPMGDGSLAALIAEAEKYLGMPYVWGGSSPSTSFDCSGFICWIFTHSGVYNLSRTTAQGIYNQCTPISPENAKPGDIIFFTGTYSSPNPVTHVGLYVGGGQMVHCGEPISYTNINTAYWQKHFYSFGRISG